MDIDVSKVRETRAYDREERGFDEVYVLKHTVSVLPDLRAMYVMYATLPAKTGVRVGFRKTLLRIGDSKFWTGLIDSLGKNDPGLPMRLSMLGVPEAEYTMYMNKIHASRAYYSQLMRKCFSRALRYEDFLAKLETEDKMGLKECCAREIEGLSLWDYGKFSENRWYVHTEYTQVPGKKRKPRRIIF